MNGATNSVSSKSKTFLFHQNTENFKENLNQFTFKLIRLKTNGLNDDSVWRMPYLTKHLDKIILCFSGSCIISLG